jgi:hypothetical protein
MLHHVTRGKRGKRGKRGEKRGKRGVLCAVPPAVEQVLEPLQEFQVVLNQGGGSTKVELSRVTKG